MRSILFWVLSFAGTDVIKIRVCAQKFQALLEDLQRRHVIVLVTSRAAPTSGLGGAKVLRLQCLPENKSVELLIDRCSEVAWLPGQAEELATRCCHKNAFAITLIGAQLNNKRCLPQVLQCWMVNISRALS